MLALRLESEARENSGRASRIMAVMQRIMDSALQRSVEFWYC